MEYLSVDLKLKMLGGSFLYMSRDIEVDMSKGGIQGIRRATEGTKYWRGEPVCLKYQNRYWKEAVLTQRQIWTG